MTELAGTILTPVGWVAGRIAFDDRIRVIDGDPVAAPGPEDTVIVPGFVDCHIHGGGGADIMSGPEALAITARMHARHGTTSLVATTVTAPLDDLDAALDGIAAVMADPPPDAARVLGVHLEGPFLNPGKLGAQPPYAIPGDAETFARLAARAPVRIITLAPECDPDGAVADAARSVGARVQVGHSLCAYAEAAAAIEAGAGITHLFNAMTPVAHRNNGVAGAALACADWAEIIPDLIHVESGAILAARRAIPNLYAVTDATAGAGMPDGPYALGRLRAIRKDGAMRLPDGTLAGSTLTMDQALRNFVAIGLPLDEAARRVSTLPADWLGEEEIGRLTVGAKADLVELTPDLTVASVRIDGVPVD